MTAWVTMLRFHLDESVKPEIAQGLRVRGIDCTTAHEVAWFGTSLMQSSWPLPRHLLLTTDDDFFALGSPSVACRYDLLASGEAHHRGSDAPVGEAVGAMPR